MLKNNFIALEVDERFWVDIDRRTSEFDAGNNLGLSFNRVASE